jgi:hypothetical protein
MNSDCFFAMGKTHTVCEDYALSGEHDGRPFAIIADGCSSSRHTDVGARLLVMALLRTIGACGGDYRSAMDSAIHVAYSATKMFDFPSKCLDATLLLVVGYPDAGELDPKFEVYAAGDGAIVARNEDRVMTKIIEYDRGAPEYLSYKLNPERHAGYLEEYGNHKTVTTHDMTTLGTDDTSDEPLNEAISVFRFGHEWDCVAVMSDGVTTFEKDEFGMYPMHPFVHFKNTKGEFVKRRCRGALRTLKELGNVHDDDFSMGAVYGQIQG